MAQRKDVYTVVQNEDKKFWNRIGTAFVNKDNSLKVFLNALPVNGQLVIRDAKPKQNPEPKQ